MSLTDSGPTSNATTWDRYAVAYQDAARLPTDVVSYGPGVGTEADFRLLGPVTGKRVLDLGCGGAQSSIALARQGATAIGIDISVEQLAFARRLMEDEEVRVELRQGDLAELAFQRADGIDIVFSAMAFQYVSDLGRVFRQVHRVLKPQGMLVFSIPHPALTVTGFPASPLAGGQLTLEPEPTVVRRSYFDRTPLQSRAGDFTFVEYHRPISEMFMSLVRSGFRVDAVVEPEPQSNSMLPETLIVRARKEA